MKIQDLLERGLIQPTVEPTKQYRGDLRQSKKVDISKSGMFSTVKDDRSDPHMVKKYNHRPNRPHREEGFRYFARCIIAEGLENIHFPRVYQMGQIEDDRGQTVDTYRMERLVGWHTVTGEEIAASAATIFSSSTPITDHARVARLVEQAIRDHNYNRIISKEFEDACKMIVSMGNDNHEASYDLHAGNMMYRRTPHGLQLVITDPFYIHGGIPLPVRTPEQRRSAKDGGAKANAESDDALLRQLGVA